MSSETYVFLEVGSAKIVVRAPADFRAEADSKVWIEFDMTRVYFFDRSSGQRLG